jgi:5-methylcytosine-specific restriction protein B
MSSTARQQQFEKAVRALPDVSPDARITSNFGFSNSARVLEGGLFACTNNLETYSEKLAAGTTGPLEQMVLMCVLTFPPHDEVYFALAVASDSGRLNKGLIKLFNEGVARNKKLVADTKKPGSISNNVKFYITEEGDLFFHNYDFKESLTEARQKDELDPDCLAKIDAIHFAIWPPAASARRSLLARQFVGYLGSLIGREKVHEMRVWDEAGAVSPGMRRMPFSIPIKDIEAAIISLEGYYPGGEVKRCHTALNFLEHKHFVILSGLSGTGKTQLGLKYARAVHGLKLTDVDPFLFVCAVRPEWTDPTGLTGYYDVLSNRYMVPPFLEAVLLATAHRDSPIFVILDEMNLARVEYYFSDVLSALETGEPLQLHSSGVPLEGSTGTSVPAELPLPQNLYLIGTINIDETTNAVSDKVLDRALLIEMSAVNLLGFLAVLQARDPNLKNACAVCEPHLQAALDIMIAHGLGFGYRVIEEVVRYQAFAGIHLGANAVTVTDDLMVQKVLAKLRGADRQRSLLTGLLKALAALPRSQALLNRLIGELNEFGSFQASR